MKRTAAERTRLFGSGWLDVCPTPAHRPLTLLYRQSTLVYRQSTLVHHLWTLVIHQCRHAGIEKTAAMAYYFCLRL